MMLATNSSTQDAWYDGSSKPSRPMIRGRELRIARPSTRADRNASPVAVQLAGPPLGGDALATKLLVPALGPEVVARPRLVERLNEATRRRVTLVAAPAGFGKTTAVAAWIDATRPPVAWLTLDEGDNDLGRFLAHLVGAVRSRWPELGADAAAQLARAPLRGPAVLAALLNELAAQSSPVTLVLDELEAVHSQEVLDAVAWVLDRQPPNLHLVLCTRREPHLPLPRLRARGQLAEVTADDLRFTLDEASLFLDEAMALRVSPQGRRALHARTEGWITGLQLAALSLRRTPDRERFIASFAGDHRHVANYLMDEVLRSLPTDVQEFLLATSVLRRLSGELCDAVTGGSGSDAMLERLAEDNLFVQRLDEQRRWYRYHGLFAELLRHRLVARDREAAKGLNRRAAAWFDERGLVPDAIHHALAGGDTELASSLVERHGSVLLARGEHRAVAGWLAALPDDAFAQHPELGAFDAMARLGARDVDGAARRLAALSQQAARLAAPPRALSKLVRILEAVICLFRDDIGRAMELAVEAEGFAAELPAPLDGMTDLAIALAHYSRGELRQARLRAERGLTCGLVQGNPNSVFHSGALLARIDLREGRLRGAEAACRELLDLAVKNGWWELSFRTLPQLALAEVLYERGALVEAAEVLESAAEIAGRLGPDEYEDLTTEWLARVRLALGEEVAAAEVEPERLVRQDFYLHLFERPVYHRLCWRLAAGEAGVVEAELRGRGLDAHTTAPDPERERDYLLLARALVARGRAAEALPLLARLLLAAEAGGRRGTALEALCLQAVARHMQGSTSQAQEALRRALELAGDEGWVRMFVDLGAPMRHLLVREAAAGVGGTAVARLLAAFGDEPPAAASAVSPLAEPIRERELDVLRCIAAGMSNAETAAQLYISLNTVKTHVRNLYGKLAVEKRVQALRRARELGLIGA
jgi:LuxR family maltose regulon positive regulatory protein